jgi:fluoroquinolone transport system ATP-binding protein
VSEGEIFGFLGPSGAGKSTTQKILTGLLREHDGEVAVLGRELATWGSDLYEEVGVSFELPNLYQRLSALENLRYFAALYARPCQDPQELLERVGLGDDARTLAGHLSKGMKVRLGFARALLHRPRLLFLDEPTAGLDPGNAQRVKDIIRETRVAGTTVFLTTHDMTAADQLCDRVAFLVDGELATIDAPEALKLRHGERKVRLTYRSDDELRSSEFPLEGIGQCEAFLALLREHPVETLHTQETTLEGVFLQVTGRHLT